jgi:hypothetical protein
MIEAVLWVRRGGGSGGVGEREGGIGTLPVGTTAAWIAWVPGGDDA